MINRVTTFMVSSDRCKGNCDTFDDPSIRKCFTSKAEDLNLNVLNMITRIRHKNMVNCSSYDFKRKFDCRKWIQTKNIVTIKTNMVAKSNKTSCKQKKKNIMLGILAYVVVSVIKIAKFIIDDLVSMHDEIIGMPETVSIDSVDKKHVKWMSHSFLVTI